MVIGQCRNCGVELIEGVNIYDSYIKSPNKMCKTCRRAQQRVWEQNHKEEMREYKKKYLVENKEQRAQTSKNYRVRLKTEMLMAYGNKCECCNESRYEFLSLEHKRGNGSAHRKEVGYTGQLYSWLKKQGFPKDDYGLLCFNCNCAKGFFGYCPHEKEKLQQSSDA